MNQKWIVHTRNGHHILLLSKEHQEQFKRQLTNKKKLMEEVKPLG
jgi:hypothetical protein